MIITKKPKKDEVNKFIFNALRNLFEIATWLRNFSVMNGLAYDRIITKCSEVIKIEKNDCPSLLTKMEKYLTEYGIII